MNPVIYQLKSDKWNTSELISKEAVLDCFCDWIDRYGNEHTADEDPVYQRIAELPAVQPERKRGHWRHVDPITEAMSPRGWMPWYCSECGAGVGKHQTTFCPNCGADMRGGETT